MKKSLIIILMIMLILCFTGCKKEENSFDGIYEKEAEDLLSDDAVVYYSLDEINEKIGCNIVEPGIMGRSMETYSIVGDTIAQYKCVLAGCEFTIRASKSQDDISGIKINDEVPFVGDDYAEDATTKAFRFFIDDMQYVIVTVDNGDLDKDTFMIVCNEVKDLCSNNSSSFAGTYVDSMSQRASATVLENEDSTYTITIEYPNSSSDSIVWDINASLNDNELSINSCSQSTVSYNEAGEAVTDNVTEVALKPFILSENGFSCTLNVPSGEIELNFERN